MGKTKVISQVDNKIEIIGDNILFINGDFTAYYIVPLTNYSIISNEGALYAINSLTSLLSTFASQRGEVEFSLQRFSKLIETSDVIKNLYKTIRIYNKDYDMPYEFTQNLHHNTNEFCLLGVKINTKNVDGVEDKNILQVTKELASSLINSFLVSDIGVDEEKILQYENNIYNALKTKCLRASKEIVFYNYISKLYPSYNISYDEMSYINEENFSNILGSVTQIIEDGFGYFTMHNTGIDFFDYEPQETYGCILNIKQFPFKIYSEQFPMDYSFLNGFTQVNIKTLKKDDAKLQLKRIRASKKWELDEALKAGAELEQLEDTSTSIAIATDAIAEVEDSTILCEFNADILIQAETREKLKENIIRIQNDLKDRDILAAKSLTQGLDFLNSYVKLKSNKYHHLAALQFPLSFQLNSGALVGCSDSQFFLPSIGRDL